MKRERGIARCGLACCLCSENDSCGGCQSEGCPGKETCQNLACSRQKGIGHCYECPTLCHNGLLSKVKPYAFTLFCREYGEEALLDCLERNEKRGVVYHRSGITGDYDDFNSAEDLITFIRTGRR